jgi:hypothetical protein
MVKVLDGDAKPVEGAPVRRQLTGAEGRGWDIVHNCNADGIATFYVRPNEAAKFGVFVTRRNAKREDEVIETMQPIAALPTEPVVTIKLNSGQAAMLRGR